MQSQCVLISQACGGADIAQETIYPSTSCAHLQLCGEPFCPSFALNAALVHLSASLFSESLNLSYFLSLSLSLPEPPGN